MALRLRSCIMRFVLRVGHRSLYSYIVRDGLNMFNPTCCAGSPSFWFGENLQRDAQQLFEIRDAGLRLLPATALSAVRPVVTRLVSAETTSASTPAGDTTAGRCSVMAMESSFVFQLNDIRWRFFCQRREFW